MLSIVVPCFNEEASLPIFFEETEKVKKHLNMPFEYIFVILLVGDIFGHFEHLGGILVNLDIV